MGTYRTVLIHTWNSSELKSIQDISEYDSTAPRIGFFAKNSRAGWDSYAKK